MEYEEYDFERWEDRLCDWPCDICDPGWKYCSICEEHFHEDYDEDVAEHTHL